MYDLEDLLFHIILERKANDRDVELGAGVEVGLRLDSYNSRRMLTFLFDRACVRDHLYLAYRRKAPVDD